MPIMSNTGVGIQPYFVQVPCIVQLPTVVSAISSGRVLSNEPTQDYMSLGNEINTLSSKRKCVEEPEVIQVTPSKPESVVNVKVRAHQVFDISNLGLNYVFAIMRVCFCLLGT